MMLLLLSLLLLLRRRATGIIAPCVVEIVRVLGCC